VSLPDRPQARVWAIAWPLILANVSTPLLGMVDTAVLGHLDSPHYLGAVAVGSVAFSFLFTAFNFLRMSTTGRAAQAFGQRDGTELRSVLGQGLLAAAVLACLMLALQRPIGSLVFGLIDAGQAVSSEAWRYYTIRIWSAPATLANFVLIGWFIGLQRARAPLSIVLVLNTVNIGLDLLLVPGLGMKTEGVAIATVAAEYCALAIGLLLAHRALLRNPGDWKLLQLFEPRRLRRTLSADADLLLRTLALMLAFALLTTIGARLGQLTLAANAVLIQFLAIASYALDGFANAAEALIGEAVGSRDRRTLDSAFSASLRASLAVAALIAVLYAILGVPLIQLLTAIEGVRSVAAEHLPWLILAPMVSVWSYFYDGVFVGATLSRDMRNTMLFALLVVYLPALLLAGPLDNHGLWLAFLMFNATRGLSQHWVWQRRIHHLRS